MEIVALLIVIGIIVFIAGRGKSSKPAERSIVEELEDDIRRERKEHHALLSAAMTACNDAHRDAMTALCWLAAADGSVSKQELRTIFRFCAEQGTAINKDTYQTIDSLNAGMSIKVPTSEPDAMSAVAALASQPAAYKLAFFAAANKLCGSQKKIAPAKQRFLKAAESLVGGANQ